MLCEIRHTQKPFERALLHALHVLETHVVRHQRFHLLHFIARETQPGQDAVRQADAFFHVPIEADALGHAKRRRLAHVVQQRSQCQRHGRLLHLLQQQQGVRPHVAFGMVFGRLSHSLHGRHFGQDVAQQVALFQQLEAAPRAAFGQDVHQFVAHALGRHRPDERVVRADGRHCRRLNREAQARGKPHGPQQPQMVLAKSEAGVADGSHHAPLQVRAAAHVVQHVPAVRVHQQAIDGEVAPPDILARIAFEAHGRRMPPVVVIVVAAERGHLHLREHVAYQHHAKRRAHPAGIGEQIHDAVGPRIRRDVEILGARFEQQVADATAHQVRLMARRAQLRDHRASQRLRFHCHDSVLLTLC